MNRCLTASMLAALVCLSGCGGTTRPAGSTVRTGPAAVTLTDGDDGRTVTVSRGQVIAVRLTADSYVPPVSDQPKVLARTSAHGGYPASGPASAAFTAQAVGSTGITAVTDRACAHVQPRCLVATRRWHVTVTVR